MILAVKAMLLERYGSAQLRPGLSALGDGTADTVDVQVYVDRFREPRGSDMTYGIDGFLRVMWTDLRLAHNATGRLVLDASEAAKIWTPSDLYWEKYTKVTLPGGAGSGAAATFFVYPNGTVFWSRQTQLILSCPMSFSEFPYDSHCCQYKMGLFSSTAADLRLRWHPTEDALVNWGGQEQTGACMIEWLVTSVKTENVELSYSTGNYTFAAANVRFTRRYQSYMGSYFGPAFMFVFAGFLGFFVDPKAVPARVTLGIVVILVTFTNYIAVQNRVPLGAKAWLTDFMFYSFLFNIFGFLELILVNLGMAAHAWVEEQRALMNESEDWATTFKNNAHHVVAAMTGWDTDSDGKLTKLEFRRGVASLGIGVPRKKIDELFATLDIDKSGEVTFADVASYLEADPQPYQQPIPVAQTGGKVSRVGVETAADGSTGGSPHGHGPKRSLVRATTGVLREIGIAPHDPTNAAAKELAQEVHEQQRKELDKGRLWSTKVFVVLPFLSRLRHLDHPSRVVLPLAYLIFTLAWLGEIDFGRRHAAFMADGAGTPCAALSEHSLVSCSSGEGGGEVQ